MWVGRCTHKLYVPAAGRTVYVGQSVGRVSLTMTNVEKCLGSTMQQSQDLDRILALHCVDPNGHETADRISTGPGVFACAPIRGTVRRERCTHVHGICFEHVCFLTLTKSPRRSPHTSRGVRSTTSWFTSLTLGSGSGSGSTFSGRSGRCRC